MDNITALLKDYYGKTFAAYGATARGVDWNDEAELLVRYDKMLAVLQKDFCSLPEKVSILDVGCGWGGLYKRIKTLNLPLRYFGVDVVESMITEARSQFPDAGFIQGDVFQANEALTTGAPYDFVVCNAILTQKLDVSIPAMECFMKRLVLRMFELSRHGIAFNLMSTRVNFMVDNLFYQNPSELLSWLLTEVSPRVRLDHAYSSLASGRGKYYDYTVYVYKDSE